MNLRILLLIAALSSAAAAAPDACTRDSDCRTGNRCVANRCSASREQEAAQGAGMALDYTKNTWPISLVDRPLVVAPGMTEATLGISKDLSTDDAVGPLHPLGADLYARYGVSDRIHAGLDAVAVCFTDCGPAGFFRSISVGAGYAVVANHDLNLVPALTAAVYNFASGTSSAQLLAIQPGFLFGWRINEALQLLSSGGLILGIAGRDNTPTPDLIGLHFEARFQPVTGFAVGPYLGYQTGLAHTEFYQVPIGVNLIYVATRAFDVGGSFQFDDVASKNLVSGTGTTVTVGGAGGRSMRVFATIRL